MSERLWEFKYSPKKFDDLIINDDLKEVLRKNIQERPNMFIYGPPGVGKGSYVDVMIAENDLKRSTLKINGSLEGGIDTIREKVLPFSQAVNFEVDKLKLVYINECDHPNLQTAQKSLRDLIESTNKVTQWILVCNYPEVIIPELKSRCQSFHISKPPAKEIFKKCEHILKSEKVDYKKDTVLEIVKKCYPDIRNTIVSLRENTVSGKLIAKANISGNDKTFEEILDSMKSGDPESVRKILKSSTIFYPQLYEFLYKKIMDEDKVFKDDAEAILLIAEHSYRDNVVAIKEINFMHMIFEMLKKGVL